MTDTLPQEVAEAIASIDKGSVFVDGDDCAGDNKWGTVRAHLHRLAEENARLREQFEHEKDERFKVIHAAHREVVNRQRVDAELAKIRKRIAEAPIGMVDAEMVMPVGSRLFQESMWDKRVALLKLEDGARE